MSTGAGSSAGERFLVTGALGCIGAWTVRELVREGVPVVAYDIGSDPRRLALILEPDELARVTFVAGDITDLDGLDRALADHEITNVVHLAALQVPFCRADPPLGARVNVVGTVNVFEAVRRRVAAGHGMAPVVYTGSIGMYSPSDVDSATGQLREFDPLGSRGFLELSQRQHHAHRQREHAQEAHAGHQPDGFSHS